MQTQTPRPPPPRALSPETEAVPPGELWEVCVGGRSLAHNDVRILCLPCFPIADISDGVLGADIDLGSSPRGKINQFKFLIFC